MTARKLRPDELPDWPRRMSVEIAAAYVGVSPAKFANDSQAGIWPEPIRDGDRILWDRKALDDAVDSQSGRSQTNPLMRKLNKAREARP